jgi:aldehyde dehydrogenase (NAD+)
MNIIEIFRNQKKYFSTNVSKDYSFRMMMLKNLKMAIVNHEDEIIEALAKDLKKPEFESYVTEIGIVYEELEFALDNLKEWMKPVKVKTTIVHKPAKSFYMWEPKGVSFIMAPWNYPFHLIMTPLIGSIAAGNTSIVKPSDQTKHTADIGEKILKNTFKEEYIYVLKGDRESSNLLLDQPLDHIVFTGSSNVGKFIMKKAAQNLVPVTLELGGKSPCIVDKEVDIDIAAKRIVWGKLINTGQTCTAPDYIVVHKDVKDKLIKLLIKYIDKFYSKHSKKESDLSRIINEKHHTRLVNLIEGQEVVYGGDHSIEDLYIEPTIINNVSWTNTIMEEEIFGPIFPIIEYTDIEYVIERIREKPKALALYIFSENQDVIQNILNNISFGGGCINDTMSHVGNPHLPLGGVGYSGMGKYHGQKSFEVFSNQKGIMDKSTKFDLKLKYPPYTKKKLGLLRKVFK